MEEIEARTLNPGEIDKTIGKLQPSELISEKIENGSSKPQIAAAADTAKKLHYHMVENCYDLNSKVGVALIFNQIAKNAPEGSQKDAMDLNDVLTEIGFNVEVHVNLTVSEITKQLQKSEFTLKF